MPLKPLTGLTVLLLEDQASWRDKIVDLLKKYGAKVIECVTAPEAVGEAILDRDNQHIDVALLDRILEDEKGERQHYQGSEVAEVLKEFRPNVCRVCISNLGGYSDIYDKDLPKKEFTEKPEKLVKCLKALLQR